MAERDDIATTNRRHWERMVEEGCGFTVPWLDLDPAALRRYFRGQVDPAPEPLLDIYPRSVLADVEGRDVLCLGAGGGQQSAVFALLGARVTVVDLAEGQPAGDRRAAEHYGYEVTTVRTDMRDLSVLDPTSFDLVYATGTCYVPDIREVYDEVAAVLRPGGVYRVDVTNPATEFVDCDDWDGEGYRIATPYTQRTRRRTDGAVEFRHYLSDIFTGPIEVGLTVEEVVEAPRHLRPPDSHATPGSWAHMLSHVQHSFAIVARKA